MYVKEEEEKVSRSRCVPLAYTLRHELRVERFNHLLDTYQPGLSIRGGPFGSAAHDPSVRFYLNIYPNGSRPFFKSWLSAFVHMDVDGLAMKRRVCRLTFALIDSEGNRVLERSAFHTLVANPDATVPADSKTNWGFRRFVEQAVAGRLVGTDGALNISVELVVCGSSEDLRIESVDCDPSQTPIAHPVLQLLRERQLTDFTLIAYDSRTGERRYLHTHRAVLAAHSPVFKAMFAQSADENSYLELEADTNAMESLVNALYDQTYFSGEVEVLVEMVLLADKYLMEGVKTECERSLTTMLTSENMLTMVERLTQIMAPNVWRRTTELLWVDWEHVRSLADWERLQETQPRRALALISAAISYRMQHCSSDDDHLSII